MDAIRIDTLPVLQSYVADDLLNLQRKEAGVWNDYQTTPLDYFGPLETVTLTWDLSTPNTEYIVAGGDGILVLGGSMTLTPGVGYIGTTVQITLLQGGNSNSFVAEGLNDGIVKSSNFVLTTDNISTPWFDLEQDVLIDFPSGPPGSYSGTAKVRVNYVRFKLL